MIKTTNYRSDRILEKPNKHKRPEKSVTAVDGIYTVGPSPGEIKYIYNANGVSLLPRGEHSRLHKQNCKLC